MEKEKNILNGEISLGIELGSTRIKSVLIDKEFNVISVGNSEWENRFENDIWTYSLDDIWSGIQNSFSDLKYNFEKKYDVVLDKIDSIGISAMMHGYMAFDKDDNLLVPFRTWRNTMTKESANQLSKLFNYNIPQRWSIAHLYQAILNNEAHVSEISYLTTLAGYIHLKLTGEKVLGIGDASGMFPINTNKNDYNESMLNKFDNLIESKRYSWKIKDLLPKVLIAGQKAGSLTKEGASLLDISGELKEGVELCPPEGDAGTGMVATNSIKKYTGNISVGTSQFLMIVLENELKQIYPEVDLVTTPMGDLVSMIHVNNCTSELNSWINLFLEVAQLSGNKEVSKEELFLNLFNKSLESDDDCGDMLLYGYHSGEEMTKLDSGRPLFVRKSSSKFNLANFMKLQFFSIFATLKIGLEIIEKENLKIDKVTGHGGIFKTPKIVQSILASVLETPVSINKTANEGGAWGMAILAAYNLNQIVNNNQTLDEFLEKKVFADNEEFTMSPDNKIVESFNKFLEKYKKGLELERVSINCF